MLEVKVTVHIPQLESLAGILQMKECKPAAQEQLPGQTEMNLAKVMPAPVTEPTAPVAPAVPVAPATAAAPTVPVTVAEYDLPKLQLGAAQLMDAGKQQELLALLQSFQVQALTLLPKEQYGAFANKLRELGAKL